MCALLSADAIVSSYVIKARNAGFSTNWSLPKFWDARDRLYLIILAVASGVCGVARKFSREIENPNNSKRNNNPGDAEAEYKPYVMPGHTLSSLPRRYYRALLRTLGKTHDILLTLRPGPF
jgi:hypothetical protein